MDDRRKLIEEARKLADALTEEHHAGIPSSVLSEWCAQVKPLADALSDTLDREARLRKVARAAQEFMLDGDVYAEEYHRQINAITAALANLQPGDIEDKIPASQKGDEHG